MTWKKQKIYNKKWKKQIINRGIPETPEKCKFIRIRTTSSVKLNTTFRLGGLQVHTWFKFPPLFIVKHWRSLSNNSFLVFHNKFSPETVEIISDSLHRIIPADLATLWYISSKHTSHNANISLWFGTLSNREHWSKLSERPHSPHLRNAEMREKN